VALEPTAKAVFVPAGAPVLPVDRHVIARRRFAAVNGSVRGCRRSSGLNFGAYETQQEKKQQSGTQHKKGVWWREQRTWSVISSSVLLNS